jgi:hypothetical protein
MTEDPDGSWEMIYNVRTHSMMPIWRPSKKEGEIAAKTADP